MKKINMQYASDTINDRLAAEIFVENSRKEISDIERKKTGEVVLTFPIIDEEIEVDAEEYLKLLQQAINELR